MNKKLNAIVGGAALASLLSFSVASAAITTTLDIGQKGPQVTELQTYLSTNSNFYPSGLITGYFGSLTQGGVERFQTSYGIVSSGTPATTGYGRVGPTTMARINSLMNPGTQATWDAVPFLSSPTVVVGRDAATVTWTTNEATIGELYYSTFPIQSEEATGPNQQPYVSGSRVTSNGGYQTSHSIAITGLTPGTNYYFLTRVVDSGNNLSMTLPTTFRTNN